MIVNRKTGLVEKTVTSCSSRLSARIKSDSCLTNENKQTPHSCSKNNSSVRNPDPRFEHQACHPSYWDVCPDSVFVYEYKSTIQNIKKAIFQENKRNPLFQRYGRWGREHDLTRIPV